ncbi:MAG: histidine kinase [Chitinophagaceae bacterium]
MKNFWLLILLLLFGNTYSQKRIFYSIDEKDHLPSNEIYDMVQDAQGFIYIGSTAGLHVYDGYTFKKLYNKKQMSVSVSNLTIDTHGQVWCQNFSGQIFCVRNDSMHLIVELDNSLATYSNYIIKDDNIWVYNNPSLLKFDSKGKLLKKIKVANNAHQVSIFNAPNNKIRLIILDSSYVQELDESKNHLKKIFDNNNFRHRTLVYSFDSLNYILVEKNPQREYFVYQMGHSDYRLIKKIQPGALANLIYGIEVIGKELCILTSNGVFIYNIEMPNNKPIHWLQGESVSGMIVDKEKNIWFSTLSNGIKVFSNKEIYVIDKNSFPFSSTNFTAMDINQLGLFFGNREGEMFSMRNNKIEKINTRLEALNKHISTVVAKDKSVYFASGGVAAIEPNGKLIDYKILPYVRDIAVSDSAIHVVSNQSHIEINRNTQTFSIKKEMNGRKQAYNPITNETYLLTVEGVQYHKDGVYGELKYKGNRIFANSICYHDSIIWIASLSEGLLGFKNKRCQYAFSKVNLLKSNFIQGIYAEKKYIWVVGENELIKIDYKNNRIVQMDNSILDDKTLLNVIKVWNDTIYLATQSGIFFFDSRKQGKENQSLNLNVLAIMAGKKTYSGKHFFSIPYSENEIKVNVKTISHTYKNNIVYRYRVKGLSYDWIQVQGAENVITLSNLPPGHYTFEVQALSKNQYSKTDILSFSFRVNRPLWRSIIALMVYFILITLVIYLIIKSHFNKIQKRTLQKQLISEYELTALKAQMNPHFIFNGLNSIQDLIAKKDTEKSNEYLSKFGNLIRKILDYSKKTLISIQQEIDVLNLYLEIEKLRFGDEFTYQFHYDNSIDLDIHIPSMILQPIIENSVKHGLFHKKGKKQLDIYFTNNETYIECVIIDNGIGRKKANEINERNRVKHKSFAMNAIQNKIQILYGKKKNHIQIVDLYDNDMPMGTKVIVHFFVDS